ncbi:hypothetical protein [Anaeromyxobacter oryzae]|uniref:O-antigen polymerase n=1 Tax=Anaeromyxobacter oryzae TaxID=2918170 RepID=A0ABM7WYS4_9BACT|nr:hypothetical protein [Anaeromyxobacter oryzae]BDG04620.1 hypothetical protein AMOR_36160 [Anaeromyxobacter oryzae]
MNLATHAALLGWIPVVLLLFASLPPRRALVAALVGGWLFLPVAGYDVTGYHDKHMVLSAGMLAGAVAFAPGRLAAFRPRLVDLPMTIWCAWPFVSSLANGLGAYEGGAAVLFNTARWGVPWLLGRTLLADRGGVRALAVGVLTGALVYVPLCLWEIRMSPQLHAALYGFHQHAFDQTVRWGGTFRPMVFMHHGLMVALWMAVGSILAVALWTRRTLRDVGGIGMPWIAVALVGTTVLTKSTGAVVLLAVGASVLLLADGARVRALLIVLALAAPAYMAVRLTGEAPRTAVLDAAARVASPVRLASLRFRLANEEQLAAKALERPITGWGRYGRWIAYDDQGRAATPDGFWVIALGQFGLVGLAAITAATVLPVVRLAVRLRRRRAAAPGAGPAVALGVVLALFAVDSLFNAMTNPVYFVAGGALAGVDVRSLVRRRRPAAAQGRAPAPVVVAGAALASPAGSAR